MTNLCDSETFENSNYNSVHCPNDRTKNVCTIGSDIILAYHIRDKSVQLEFIDAYTINS